MLFDKACRLAERGDAKVFRDQITGAPVFDLRSAGEEYEEGIDPKMAAPPFPVVWVEAPSAGSLICEVSGERVARMPESGCLLRAIGVNLFLPTTNREGVEYAGLLTVTRVCVGIREDGGFLLYGHHDDSEQGINMVAYDLKSGKPKGQVSVNVNSADDSNYRSLVQAINKVTYGLALINEPTKFVVKVSPEKARKVQRGKVPRSNQRPRYIMMPLEEIDRIIRQPNPENKTGPIRKGHRRRGHWKRLRSERYKYKRGQLIRVSPCWVGPKEGVKGGERYVVLTEL